MKLISILIGVLILNTSFNNGSGASFLTCRSASGKVVFKATIDDITGVFQNAKLVIDRDSLVFNENDKAVCIFDQKNGVYTLYIENDPKGGDDYKYLTFWCIPSTFKTISNSRANQKYEFKGKLWAKDPRKNKGPTTPTIELICTLVYRI